MYGALAAVTLGAVSITGCSATIGGTEVPDHLQCEEDEVITFVGVDTLDCVHLDSIIDEEVARRTEIWVEELEGVSTIGGEPIPGNLECEEDEVIGYAPVGEPPYPLVCYYWEGGTIYVDGEEVPMD